jgi:N-acyl amino acid synthase FeeM
MTKAREDATESNTREKLAQKLRNRIKIDPLVAKGFQFKIAEKRGELESACRLVHDNYIRKGYMTPQESGLRLTIRNALPETTTFIGQRNQSVVFTLTVFQDSGLGLPMDAIYKQEVDQLRAKKRKIVEVGSLAMHPSLSKGDHTVLMLGNKLMRIYCREYLGVDDLVITINPRHRWFYEHVLLFERIGDMRAYEYVGKAPALAYRLDLGSLETRMREAYEHMPVEKNLHRFFFQDNSSCISLPEEKRRHCFWNLERITYFFQEKTRLLAEASRETVECLQKHYEGCYGHLDTRVSHALHGEPSPAICQPSEFVSYQSAA